MWGLNAAVLFGGVEVGVELPFYTLRVDTSIRLNKRSTPRVCLRWLFVFAGIRGGIFTCASWTCCSQIRGGPAWRGLEPLFWVLFWILLRVSLYRTKKRLARHLVFVIEKGQVVLQLNWSLISCIYVFAVSIKSYLGTSYIDSPSTSLFFILPHLF